MNYEEFLAVLRKRAAKRKKAGKKVDIDLALERTREVLASVGNDTKDLDLTDRPVQAILTFRFRESPYADRAVVSETGSPFTAVLHAILGGYRYLCWAFAEQTLVGKMVLIKWYKVSFPGIE